MFYIINSDDETMGGVACAIGYSAQCGEALFRVGCETALSTGGPGRKGAETGGGDAGGPAEDGPGATAVERGDEGSLAVTITARAGSDRANLPGIVFVHIPNCLTMLGIGPYNLHIMTALQKGL